MRSDASRRSGGEEFDAVIVGGGHNALVAAAYLARAGLSVCVLEQANHVGGAAVSDAAFAGVGARLSRYSYLVSLFPDAIARDLGVHVPIVSRDIASYTPVRVGGADAGLLVERHEGPATAASFREVTGSHEAYTQWRDFYATVAGYAQAVAPTFLQPLRAEREMRERVGADAWERFVEQPLATTVEAAFASDLVRGVVLTDGLIGTFTSAADPARAANRCFLYHVAGNGNGEWRVPVGGMGALTDELADVARRCGAVLRTSTRVTAISTDGVRAEVTYASGEDGARGGEGVLATRYVLCGAAPAVLDRLLGRDSAPSAEGAQLKVNMVVSRLPRLRSGVDPRLAFAGTLHVDEGFATLEAAYRKAADGALPEPLPEEIYCHTLTDPSILTPELAASGAHTLTLFGLHMPARLFTDATNAERRAHALDLAVRGLDAYLAEPLADCLLADADGEPCIEAVTPLDLERTIGLPRGNIFHGELSWPWSDGSADPAAQPGAWGVETDLPNVFVCGAGARRGGGVSGIGGHNAAMAVVEAARR